MARWYTVVTRENGKFVVRYLKTHNAACAKSAMRVQDIEVAAVFFGRRRPL